MSNFNEEYRQQIRHWWNELPQPVQDQLHKAATDDYMDDNLAGMIHNSANFVSGPMLIEWEKAGSSWQWSQFMRQVVLSEHGKES